jgi:hypothetical protein
MPEKALVVTRPLRPILDAIVDGARPHRSKDAHTQQELAGKLDGVEHADLDWALPHLLCANLVFMRHIPDRTGEPRYTWVYVPTAACKRLLKATAEQGGPTEEKIAEAHLAFISGSGRGGGAS